MVNEKTPELRSAAEAFGSLSAQHGDVGQRRLTLLMSGVVLVLAFILAFAIDLARTTSSRRYAHAVRRERVSSARCDLSLARRHFWVGPFVRGRELCADHLVDKAVALPDEQADKTPPAFSFLVVGDFGRDGMCCSVDVAIEMGMLATHTKPAFVVAAGDNFYESGIKSAHDSQIDRSWRSVFLTGHDHAPALQVPWYVVVGNHDHEGSVQAQIELSKSEKYWNMPSHYYFKTFFDETVFVAFLDTSCMYYTAAQKKRFTQTEALTEAFRDTQLRDVEKQLADSKAKWKIVIGHHPFYSGSEDAMAELENQKTLRNLLAPMFNRTGVATYISGHEHLMEHYDADGLQSFVSGAGSKIRQVSVRQPKSVFSEGRQGFLEVAVQSKESDSLKMRFVDYTGAVVHTANVVRNAS